MSCNNALVSVADFKGSSLLDKQNAHCVRFEKRPLWRRRRGLGDPSRSPFKPAGQQGWLSACLPASYTLTMLGPEP